MANEINEIKTALEAANAKADKIAADVDLLNTKIQAGGDAPTPEQWAEVKGLAQTLNNKLQAVDDKTPEEGGSQPPAETTETPQP